MTIDEHIIANDVLREVSSLLENQTAKGLAKYKTTVNAADYSLEGWINHAQEEIIDLLVYLTVIKRKYREYELTGFTHEEKQFALDNAYKEMLEERVRDLEAENERLRGGK